MVGKGKKKQRAWTDDQEAIMVARMRAAPRTTPNGSSQTCPSFEWARADLVKTNPEVFGPPSESGASAVSRQALCRLWKRHEDGEKLDRRGRPNTLPQEVIDKISETLRSVIDTKATLFAISQLRPIAVGVLQSCGYGALLTRQAAKGVFSLSVRFMAKLLHGMGCTFRKPVGDARKIPPNGVQMCRDMVLRLAYYVKVFNVEGCLVLNPDHTGCHMTQIKGSQWQVKGEKQGSVQNMGDKRQFTAVCGVTCGNEKGDDEDALPVLLPWQVIVEGSTMAACPQVDGVRYVETLWGYGGPSADKAASLKEHEESGQDMEAPFKPPPGVKKKISQKITRCFEVLSDDPDIPAGVASVCATHNHWADHTTSIDYVDAIAAPYFKRVKNKRGWAKDRVCVLLCDCWWGWLDLSFRNHVKTNYPWMKLLYVPPACTPIGQPCDGGVIAMGKGVLRRCYGAWVAESVIRHLNSGLAASAYKPVSTLPIMKGKLFEWLQRAVEVINGSVTKRQTMREVWRKQGFYEVLPQLLCYCRALLIVWTLGRLGIQWFSVRPWAKWPRCSGTAARTKPLLQLRSHRKTRLQHARRSQAFWTTTTGWKVIFTCRIA